MKNILFIALSGIFFASWPAIAATLDQATTPGAEQTGGQVPHLSGGVGLDEREQMLAQEKNFNLKLTFAAQSGPYLANVDLAIRDAAGATLLTLASDGPIVLVQLPPGSYRIEASANGKAQQRNIRIDTKKRTIVNFLWDSE